MNAEKIAEEEKIIEKIITWSLYEQNNKIEENKENIENENILLTERKWKGGDQLNDAIKMINFFNENRQKDTKNMLIYRSLMGSGKSATIMHLSKEFGKIIIVVPNKHLQEQYYRDYYIGNKFVLDKNNKKLKISVLMGRNNFECRYLKDKDIRNNCDSKDPYLPCNRKLKDGELRYMAACECRYWIPSPMLKVHMDSMSKHFSEDRGMYILNTQTNNETIETIEKIEKFIGLDDQTHLDLFYNDEITNEITRNEITRNETNDETTKLNINPNLLERMLNKSNVTRIELYNSKRGSTGVFFRDNSDIPVCEYYKQFYDFIDADIIVMNNAKWLVETEMGRKPIVNIEIIDEADDFLDRLNKDIEIERKMLETITQPNEKITDMKYKAIKLFDMCYENLPIQKSKFYPTNDGTFGNMIYYIRELLYEYARYRWEDSSVNNKINDLNKIIKYIDKGIMLYDLDKRKFVVSISYLDLTLLDLLSLSSKNILLMSGTIQDAQTLDNLFGINEKNYSLLRLEGRTDQIGKLLVPKHDTILLKINYNIWQDDEFKLKYSKILNYIVDKIKYYLKDSNGRIIIPSNAKKYIAFLRDRDDVYFDTADDDKNIHQIYTNKKIIASTRMSRGIDLHDDLCRAIIIPKFPYPDTSSIFWEALRIRFQNKYFNILKDKARRELIQAISRGLRHENDWTYVITPDQMAFNEIQIHFFPEELEKDRKSSKEEQRKRIYANKKKNL